MAIVTVAFLDTGKVIPKSGWDLRRMQITWTVIRLIGPYDDSL
jgi:hypothetical protein